MHEDGLPIRKGVVPLVGSQEQRALLVPLTNRGSTGDFVLLSVPGHALHEKGSQRQESVVSLVAARTKSASRPPDKPRINRRSTGDFVLPSVYIKFRLFVLLERR